MNIADIAAIVNGAGGGGGTTPSLTLIHIDENNMLDKTYNDITEMLRNGMIPFAVISDESWTGIYVFLEALYNEDPDDPIYLANAFNLDGGNPSTAAYTARTPDAPLEG